MKNFDEKNGWSFDEKDDWGREGAGRCNQAILMWLAPAVFLLGFFALTVAAAAAAAGGAGWAAVAPYVIFAGLCLLLCAAFVIALVFSTLLWAHAQSQANQP